MVRSVTRRRLLVSCGAGGTAVFAGCPEQITPEASESSDGTGPPDSTSSPDQPDDVLHVRSGERHTVEPGTVESYRAVAIHGAGTLQVGSSGVLQLTAGSGQ